MGLGILVMRQMPKLKIPVPYTIPFLAYIPSQIESSRLDKRPLQCISKQYSANSTITVLSPLAPGTTTSPTPSLNQTATITTSTTLPPTTVTEQTTLPSVTMAQTVTATPSGFYYTPKPTVTTMKVFTSIPTSTPTQKSPFGIEFSILAISAAILIVRSQYRKP